VFLLCYLVVLKLLTSRLRHSFPNFYTSQRPTILATNFLLIGSISARILIALMVTSDAFLEKLNKSLHGGTWLYPGFQLVTAVITTLVPLATIIYSLMNATHQRKLQLQSALGYLETKYDEEIEGGARKPARSF